GPSRSSRLTALALGLVGLAALALAVEQLGDLLALRRGQDLGELRLASLADGFELLLAVRDLLLGRSVVRAVVVLQRAPGAHHVLSYGLKLGTKLREHVHHALGLGLGQTLFLERLRQTR